MKRENVLEQSLAFCILLLSAYVGLFCLLGCYSSPSADDFSNATAVRTLGFWKAQAAWYMNWGGRVTQTLLLSLVYKLDNLHGVYFLLPCVTVVSMLTVLYFSVSTLAVNLYSVRQKLFLSLLLSAAWLATMPVLNEVF